MARYAIGDVHGCARTLAALLDRVAPTDADELVFVGDYVDRGPDSRGVLDLLLELEARVPCVFLRGNHEALVLDALDAPRDEDVQDLWRINGGAATLASYPGGRLSAAHVDFLRRTRLVYDTPDAIYVHAGLSPELTVEENLRWETQQTFLWTRRHLDASRLAWEKTVVCGHTPSPEPVVRARLLMIDTGCVFPARPGLGRLCAVRMPERAFLFEPYQG